jgi:glycosyltransferase involved in cell wall biosynthesis
MQTGSTEDHRPAQLRIRSNDWSILAPAKLGQWAPALSVSVVIPAFNSATLPYCLASLASQSYPESLLEVVIADDRSSPPLELPPIRPANTRITVVTDSWGRANACKQAAESANGDVIFWLDSDMLLHHDHVEAQLRWHHLIDYAVVLGHKTFIDALAALPDIDTVRRQLDNRAEAAMFTDRWSAPHEWVETLCRRTDELRSAGERAYLAHVGATASVGRGLYLDCGGIDASLKLGEDIELGYRLSQAGGVFIPDRQAKSWHLGRSTVMEHKRAVNRYNEPFLADRVSQLRRLRQSSFRTYAVPYVQVVIDTRGRDLEDVKATVDAVLASSMKDVKCLLLGDWKTLDDERVSPLEDVDREARLIDATYRSEPRVDLVHDVSPSAYPSAFRATLPVGWCLGPDALSRLTAAMNKSGHGLRSVLMPDGSVARIERTSAVMRMERLRQPGEDIDDVIDEVAGTWWSDGLEEDFRSAGDAATAMPKNRPPRAQVPDFPPDHPAGETAPGNEPQGRSPSAWWRWVGVERRSGAERRTSIDRRHHRGP